MPRRDFFAKPPARVTVLFIPDRALPNRVPTVFFESMAEAAKEGKKALAHFLAKQAA
jgi:hypothetical protein